MEQEECTMKYTNTENQSLSIAVWLVTDSYDKDPFPGQLHISVTGLLKPARMIVLSGRLTDAQAVDPEETEYDISMNIPNRMGTAIHSGIENAWIKNYKQALKDLGYPQAIIDRIVINPSYNDRQAVPNCIPVYMEQRIHKTIEGYIVSGKYDFVGEGIIEDFKSTGVYGYMKKDPHDDELKILQGSIYRWLNPDIVTADHMLIQYVFTDWSKLDSKIRAKRGYPASRIVPKKLMLKSIPETESWIRQKIQLVKSLELVPEHELPLCTDEELWQSKPVYKYFKNPTKTKRSTANFDDYHLAHARLLKDGNCGLIKEFKGTVRRCGYCTAYELCTQKNAYLNNGTLQLP